MRKREICVLFVLVLMFALLPVPASADDGCAHDFVYQTLIEATCTQCGMDGEVCTSCELIINAVNTDPLGHSYGEWSLVSGATCQSPGIEQCVCERCGDTLTRETALADHHYESTVVAPGCEKDGYTRHVCVWCSDSYTDSVVPAAGHQYDSGVITKEATITAMGRITYTCTVCGQSKTDTTPKLTNPFVDVKQSQYYFDSVLWAVNQGITQGVDETHFVPDAICNRAQVVTFLWRAAGMPQTAAAENPFVDVAPDQYYYQAVLWAVANGITQGIDASHFGPDESCTRAQVVTFLYRAKGCPATEAVNCFTDVAPSDYFYCAVSWAAARGITTGVYGEAFGPNQVCSRAQIVTFLYRDAKNP